MTAGEVLPGGDSLPPDYRYPHLLLFADEIRFVPADKSSPTRNCAGRGCGGNPLAAIGMVQRPVRLLAHRA